MMNVRRLAGAFLGCLFSAALFLAPAAQAETACPARPLVQPFLAWGDTSLYMAVAGDGFGTPLALPAGASEQSHSICVTTADRTLRFFIAGSGRVRVDLVHGAEVRPVATVSAAGTRAPTPVIVIAPTVAGWLSAATTQLSVRLVGISGDALVDDVFIDPWNRG